MWPSSTSHPRVPRRRLPAWVFAACLLVGVTRVDAATWQTLEPGLELARFDNPRARDGDDEGPDPHIVVLRADPARWRLDYASGPAPGKTAKQWSAERGYVATINAGMYAADFRTHIGHVRVRDQVLSPRINRYQSLAAFDARPDRDVASFRIFDLEDPATDIGAIADDYTSLVQNLRLVDRQRGNRWRDRGQRWSEAALAEDARGNILFVFTALPMTMPDFNEALLALEIDLVTAQHLEGGREAQLHVRAGDTELEFAGVRLVPFQSFDEPVQAWPVPNVLGLLPRESEADATSDD
jgi:hypothetical protein